MRPNNIILNPIPLPGVVTHLKIDSRLYVQELFRVINMADQQHQCWDQWDSVNQVIEEQYPELHYDIIGDVTNLIVTECGAQFDALKSMMRETERVEGGLCDFVVMMVDPTCVAVEVTMYEPF